jgi:hypothetical protein
MSSPVDDADELDDANDDCVEFDADEALDCTSDVTKIVTDALEAGRKELAVQLRRRVIDALDPNFGHPAYNLAENATRAIKEIEAAIEQYRNANEVLQRAARAIQQTHKVEMPKASLHVSVDRIIEV